MTPDGGTRPRTPRRVLLLTTDPVGAQMSGSAIRAFEVARALAAAGHLPTLAAPGRADGVAAAFTVARFDRENARRTVGGLLRSTDVVVSPLHGLVEMPFLSRARVPLVIDLYDPSLFEILEAARDLPLAARRRRVRVETAIWNHVLRRGDFFLCASERQRDFVLGALAANGRFVPSGDGRDPSLRALVDVMSYGIPEAPSAPRSEGRPVLRGVHAAIRPHDTVVVWGGSTWPWLDAPTAVRAIAAIAKGRDDVHLVFGSTDLPASVPPDRAAAEGVRAVADGLRMTGRHVHFLEGWLGGEDWSRLLAECDAGISTHRRHLESRFAYRLRIVSCLGAGLPVICTEGDVLAELVGRHGLGVVVPELDVAAVAGAIVRIADPEFRAACRARIAEVRPLLSWHLAARPLVEFCDSLPPRGQRASRVQLAAAELRVLVASAWRVLSAEGPREAARRLQLFLMLRS
ncbi:MAG: hypothetical protein QOD06_1850 [Candidatus Binatota bacterium]|nr:hypothetical protein [Candidatus Binatota bacterium]